jgi:hypothetical protein
VLPAERLAYSVEPGRHRKTHAMTQRLLRRICVQDIYNAGVASMVGKCPAPVRPSIFTEQGATNRAVALDSVTRVRGPFRVLTDNNFSADHHTRVILFTSDLGMTQPDPTQLIVQAGGVTLTVENVGLVVGVSGMSASYIIVRLPEGLPNGDLPLVITLRLHQRQFADT